jgi:hypothetical protein
MSAEDKQPCPNWDDHDFEEVYYGTKCRKCDLFYAFGCEPWVDDEANQYELKIGEPSAK